MANDLEKTSNQIIDETNTLLQDIDNPEKQQKLKRTLDDAKSKLEKAQQSLKDEAKQFDDPFAEERVTLLDLGDQIKSSMDDVLENALNGNQNGTQDGLQKVQEGVKELVDQLKEELAHTTDPQKKKKIANSNYRIRKIDSTLQRCRNKIVKKSKR